MVTWRELASEVADSLRATGNEHADVDARRLVEEAAGVDGSDYLAVLDTSATERGVAALDRMAARRRDGEPLQYVIGRWGFRSLELFVDARVLIPRPETEMVAGFVLDEIDRAGLRTIVDLGTGSGAIALSVAVERPDTTVWATDRSADALAVARANLAGTGRPAARVTLAEGSWYDALPADLAGSVDLIVSNPPYVAIGEDLPAVVVDWEPADALVAGPDGTEDLVAVLYGAPCWLSSRGVVVVELAPHQAQTVAEAAISMGYAAAEIRQDLTGRDRAVIARLLP